MKRACFSALALASLAWPADAVTVSNGVIIFNQADVVAGNITPGDTPGFPATLSVSGVYRLSGNLAPTAGKIGIDVTVAEVTIDLFGFRIAGSGTASTGIEGRQRALTVMNGTIRGFMNGAIYLDAGQTLITNMRLSDNGYGVFEAASSTGHIILRYNNIVATKVDAIYCRDNCTIDGNNISDNVGGAIIITSGLVMNNNIAGNRIGINALGIVGINNNTIVGNSTSFAGQYRPMGANLCDPACAQP